MEYNSPNLFKGKAMKIQTSIKAEEVFYNEAIEEGTPFDLTLPSDELKERITNIKTNTNTQTYKTTDELFED
jgi:antitoxin component of RelBE/YafQ-DinJ toxin-antitoxin module